MPRPLAVAALVFLCVLTPAALAAEPHLEFVRGLREKGYADLAREYLQKLSKDPPAELAPLLPLEMAKTLLDVAAAEPAVPRRLAQYREARAQFETFLKLNARHPQASEARLELARVTALEGKTQLGVALREEGAAQKATAGRARALFEEAGKQYEASVKDLQAQLEQRFPEEPKTPQDQAAKKALEQAALQAQLDLAVNYLETAQTYLDTSRDADLKTRSLVAGKAKDLLGKLAAGDEKLPLTWQAMAWLGKAHYETGVPLDARKRLNRVLGERVPEAAAGQRLARYFLMQIFREAAQPKENPDVEVQKLGEEWLRLYKAHANTPEGYGVRFLLAEALLNQGFASKQPLVRDQLFQQAIAHYRQIEQTENEYTEKARQMKVKIIFERQGRDKPRADVAQLRTFDDCFVRAQFEYVQMAEEAKKDDPKLDEKQRQERRKAHLDTITRALTRALELAKAPRAQVPDSELGAAKALLAYTYLNTDRPEEARQVGEELAYQRSPNAPLPNAHSSKGAIYALEAYERLPEERAGMRKLAEYAERQWGDEPAGQYARHQLGALLIQEEKYAEAVDKLAQIKPDYASYTFAQFQLALAALEAHKRGLKPSGPDRRTYEERALATLRQLPEPPGGSGPATVHTYLLAKVRLGFLLFGDGKYAELRKLVAPLEARLGEVTDDAKREEVKSGLVTLSLLSAYGEAEALYKAGKYDEVIKLLDPVVAKLKAGELAEVKKNPQLRLALLGLALRANVQAGKTDRAQDALKLLTETGKDEGALGADPNAVLLQFVQTLQGQVQELRQGGDKTKEQLDKTVQSFTGFLDQLAKQEKMPAEVALFLANSYLSLDQHEKAAGLLRNLAEPAADAEQKQQQYYRGGRLLLIRALRQAEKFDEAEQAIKEVEAQPWGRNLQVEKEKFLLLQGRQKYREAALKWDALMRQLKPRMTQDPGIRDLYWEAYYHLVYCVYKDAQARPDPQKREQGTKTAANFIVRLEAVQADMGGEASKKRFDELLAAEAPLKQQYDALKGGNP